MNKRRFSTILPAPPRPAAGRVYSFWVRAEAHISIGGRLMQWGGAARLTVMYGAQAPAGGRLFGEAIGQGSRQEMSAYSKQSRGAKGI